MLTCDLPTPFELGSGWKDKTTLEKHVSEHEASNILLQYWGHQMKWKKEILKESLRAEFSICLERGIKGMKANLTNDTTRVNWPMTQFHYWARSKQ